ncbi:DUF3619 family protein [Massilia glaciei]|uniref:DUF3619 domain-containing protein n=1 Tax=Massilia glaciei TaxID=1524097 RepID=A0A2U2HLL4_9BURK|nr:DUF3619 family protein [Massilia glaciei]PWF48359.1 DUF3619 domain-containing protein [Massilia glaciei]
MNTDDINFAYKVRHALNEKLDDLPASTTDRLASARKLALSRKKAQTPARLARLSLAAKLLSNYSLPSLGGRIGVAVPLLALVVGLAGVFEVEEQRRGLELAELEAGVLSDELPLTAYLDDGFNAYLAEGAERAQ